MANASSGIRTLAIDVGGSGLKMIVLDGEGHAVTERSRAPTPKKRTPDKVLAVLGKQIATQGEFDRVSVGFPGLVVDGVVHKAVNLDPAWDGFNVVKALQDMTDKPVRVANDADVQGLGVIDGPGCRVGHHAGNGDRYGTLRHGYSVPNLEFGHHPFSKGRTYEECLGNAAMKKAGNEKVESAAEESDRDLGAGVQLPDALSGWRQRAQDRVQAAEQCSEGAEHRGSARRHRPMAGLAGRAMDHRVTPTNPMNRRWFTRCLAGAVAGFGAGLRATSPGGFRYVLSSCMYGTMPVESIVPEVRKTGAEHIDIWPRVHGQPTRADGGDGARCLRGPARTPSSQARGVDALRPRTVRLCKRKCWSPASSGRNC